MKSTSQAPVVTPPTPTTTEYVKIFGDTRQVWNIKCSSAAAADVASAAIEDYYDEEYTALPQVPGAPLDKARPRHHALVAAALRSSLTLTERDFPKSSTTITTTRTATTTTAAAVSSVYQKHHLVTLSAMCGLLVTRLLITGHSRSSSDHNTAPHHLWRPLKRHARFTTHYIHSALASEILIGNRYYRNITRCSALTGPIGNTTKDYTASDIAPEFVSATKQQLCAVYASEIARLTDTVQQFKRGFVNLDTIHSDPQFKRLFSLYWLYCNQVMKIQSEFEKCRLQQDAVVGGDRLTLFYAALDKFNERKDVKRFLIVSDVSEVPAMIPRLYDYDIVHLFDWSKQSYARYVRTVKSTLVRLANDGLTSAFLSFAAIEPRMVTPEMAPKHGMLYQTLSLKSCANHIPSRHPVYGALRVQHSAHIPRTADAAAVDSNTVRRDSDRRRPRTYRYVPVHTTMTEIRNNSIQSMATDELSAGEKKRALVSK
jgi:hypothetical protein